MTDKTGLKRLLIFDDDADFRKLLLLYLRKIFSGVEIEEYDPVARGVPAEDFDWSRYDVLILDYYLCIHNVTGLDILQANRKNRLFPATIMLTGAGNEEVAVRALKAGVYDYLRKENLDKDQLRRSIMDAFEKHKVEQQRLGELTNQSNAFNKVLFYQELEQGGEDEPEQNRILLLIQLDGNEALEESAGIIMRDNIVRHMAKQSFDIFQLGQCNPHITRLSDDTVALLIDDPDSAKTLEFNVNGLCTHLKKHPYKFDERKFRFTVSVGVVPVPREGRSAEVLIHRARHACEIAAVHKGNSFHIHAAVDELSDTVEVTAEVPSLPHVPETTLTMAPVLETEMPKAALATEAEPATRPGSTAAGLAPAIPQAEEVIDLEPTPLPEAAPRQPVTVEPGLTLTLEEPPTAPETEPAASGPASAAPAELELPETVPAPKPRLSAEQKSAPAAAPPHAPAAKPAPKTPQEPSKAPRPETRAPTTPARAPAAAKPDLPKSTVTPLAPTPAAAARVPAKKDAGAKQGAKPSAAPPARPVQAPGISAADAATPAKPAATSGKTPPTQQVRAPAAPPPATSAPAQAAKPAAPAPVPPKAKPASKDEAELDVAQLDPAAQKLKKAFDEKRVVQAFQPVIPLFNTEGTDQREVYKVRLQLIDRDGRVVQEDQIYEQAASPAFRKFIDRWLLRETIGRVVNAAQEDYVFVLRISDASLADPSLFNWLRKLLAGLEHRQPGRNILLEVAAAEYTDQQKKAAALMDYLNKSHGFHFVLASLADANQVSSLIESKRFNLLKINYNMLEQLQGGKPAPSEGGSALEKIKSGGTRIIVDNVEDSTTLTNVISAGAHYAMGNFIGEPITQLGDQTNVESFEIT